MQIVNIFTIVKENLYSVLFDISDQRECGSQLKPRTHEFSRLFDLWNDASSLREFFEENQEDLNDPFWEGISIDEAILKTRKEAKALKMTLKEFAEADTQGKGMELTAMFAPLSDAKFEKPPAREKAKIKKSKTWLRIYAIRVDKNVFVICGGAIKLRETMNDRNWLLMELDKLNYTKNYLNNSESDFFELNELKF